MKDLEETLLDELMPDDLKESQRDLVEAIGMKAFIQGCKSIGGSPWYFPTIKVLAYSVKKRKVAEEYNGRNAKKLAIKYNISESSVYKIMEENRLRQKKNLS